MGASPEFDLDRYLRASKRVDLSDVAWDRVKEHPLLPADARVLAYMMDIESHTVVFLRDLLATRAAFDPDVTAFLSCWAYEELWHGEAFSRFLGEAGYRLAPDRAPVAADDAYPTRSARNGWIRRKVGAKGYVSHLLTLGAAAVVPDFVAVHMTWGAVNELSTLSAYHRLMARTDHPVLVEVLDRIVKDERRHFAFYRAQARLRLGASQQARNVTRFALRHLWAPVGTGVRPQAETDFVVEHLFGDADGLAACERMDETIQALPGLQGLHLLTDSRRDVLRRLAAARGAARPAAARPAAPSAAGRPAAPSSPASRERLVTPLAAFRS